MSVARSWVVLLRTFQLVEGARANARDAVRQDRRRAEERRQAMQAAARVPGQQIGLELDAPGRR